MATLKDDDGSWKAHGLKKKVADWENDPKPRVIHNKKKDTRKWCRGKVGVLHDVQIVLVVTPNKNCFTKERCGHWRHHETKCVNCGKSSYHVAGPTNDKQRLQKQLEEKWCVEGHLWDTVESRRPIESWNRDDDGNRIVIGYTYSSRKTCLMCDKKKGKAHYRREYL